MSKPISLVLMLLLWLTPVPVKAQQLYQELGGRSGISQLVETFILEIAQDDRIIHYFANADIDRFHEMLTIHLCEVSGGPCKYEGAAMRNVHRGMAISTSEFNALVEDLIAAMEAEEIPVGTQNKLLAILAAMRDDIILL
ncbi:group 1 truncated hemoglobin [Pseudidiomarina sp.]|uniref:group I truncated hemoglobin n=1 Tax=Pseudidiomarina sp. TaxID=2081707 RepID=UPI00299DEE66|nr:group 1 truncated hemoglobin [Pseudidiomarina sp.]MDX1705097.1 group 1 truncated hemoglobin [Pseudidiomarina sp.]